MRTSRTSRRRGTKRADRRLAPGRTHPARRMMRRFWLGVLVLILLGAGARHLDIRALALEVDMDAVFRCTAKDAAVVKRCRDTRGIIMNNCTVCHSFVPIVMQQFDANGWDSLM